MLKRCGLLVTLLLAVGPLGFDGGSLAAQQGDSERWVATWGTARVDLSMKGIVERLEKLEAQLRALGYLR